PAVGALVDAAALGARVEDGGGLRVDGQSGHREIGQPRTDGAPALPAVGAPEDPIGARSHVEGGGGLGVDRQGADECVLGGREIGDGAPTLPAVGALEDAANEERSEEHTSELQSRFDLVCRLLLEKKNADSTPYHP